MANFQSGDMLDTALSNALKHEFLRCEDAFKDFEVSGTRMIMMAQNAAQTGKPVAAEDQRQIAYKTYNAYSRFIHHLYEFMLGALKRDTKNTKSADDYSDAERYIAGNTQRILTNRREAIKNGTAPSWENHISAYPEKIPPDFAKDFRRYRNKIIGHVSHERSTLSLSEFYERYHMYLYMLYYDCRGFWGLRDQEFPDLKEITDFSILIEKMPPSQP